jgi:hypothetical protein
MAFTNHETVTTVQRLHCAEERSRVHIVGTEGNSAMSNGTTRLERKWSTEELEAGNYPSSLHMLQMYETERILRERYIEPDRRLTRRLYNVAAWTLAFSVGTFVVALVTYWLVATGI